MSPWKNGLWVGLLLGLPLDGRGYETLQGPTETRYWDEARAWNGYTLFGARGTSYLIDMEGRVVNTWPVGTNPRFLDNGNLLDASTDDPRHGAGFIELDWDGNTVWEYHEDRDTYEPHHDFVRIFNNKLNTCTTLYIGPDATRPTVPTTARRPMRSSRWT